MAAKKREQDLSKGVGSATVKPKGAPANQTGVHEESHAPPSMTGLPAPGNTAGPGRGNKKTASGLPDNAATKVKPSESAKTNVSMNSSVGGQEFVYLSKK